MKSCMDRRLGSFVIAAVILNGVIGSHAMAIVFGAITLIALRVEAHVLFVQKHGRVIGLYGAYVAVLIASAAGAACRCSLAFATGALIRNIS